MKKYIHGVLLLLSCLVLLTACKSTNSKADLSSARVNYVNNEGRNTVTVFSMDYGDDKYLAVFNAKKQAFQNLFFRGISGSPFNDPLIGINERAEYGKHKDYLNDFYANRMESFILSASENVEKVRGGQKRGSVRMKINVRALRKDLEDKKIIKKFGL